MLWVLGAGVGHESKSAKDSQKEAKARECLVHGSWSVYLNRGAGKKTVPSSGGEHHSAAIEDRVHPRGGNACKLRQKPLGDLPASKQSPCDDQHGRQSVNTVRKTFLSIVILLVVLLCAAVPRLQAEDLDRCQRRVAHTEHQLHEAIHKHA